MATRKKTPGGTQYVPDSVASAEYTVPTGFVAILQKLTVCNQSGSSESIDIHIADDAGAAGVGNILFDQTLVDAGETKTFNIAGHVIAAGGKFYIKTDTASAVTYKLTLDERDQKVSATA